MALYHHCFDCVFELWIEYIVAGVENMNVGSEVLIVLADQHVDRWCELHALPGLVALSW